MRQQSVPWCVFGRHNGGRMSERFGDCIAEIVIKTRQDVAMGMTVQPGFLLLVDVSCPKAAIRDSKLLCDFMATVDVFLISSAGDRQHPIDAAACVIPKHARP